MKFRFSKKITIIGCILILAMLRLSYWQWQRHLSKIEYIKVLQQRLEMPVSNINEILEKNTDLAQIAYRRLNIEGEYDFSKEIVLRNRRLDDIPGVYILTPLKITGRNEYILVSRGFAPLGYTTQDKRHIFQKNAPKKFLGLIKDAQEKRIFAPSDPESGNGAPWVDSWLRVDIKKISLQLPYPLLPFYAEVMTAENTSDTQAKILTAKSGRDDMFFLAGKSGIPAAVKEEDLAKYPVAVYDTVIPPARHLGYVFEWAIMALMTFLICLILQFKRPKSEPQIS